MVGESNRPASAAKTCTQLVLQVLQVQEIDAGAACTDGRLFTALARAHLGTVRHRIRRNNESTARPAAARTVTRNANTSSNAVASGH